MQSYTMALVLWSILAGVTGLNAQTSPGEPGRSAAQPGTPQQQSQTPQQAAAESKLTFEGDTALWTVVDPIG